MVLNGFPMVSHGFRMVLHGFLWLFSTFRMVFVQVVKVLTKPGDHIGYIQKRDTFSPSSSARGVFSVGFKLGRYSSRSSRVFKA